MGTKVNTRVFNVLRQVQKSGVFTIPQMREVETVVSYLKIVKEDETAQWIDTHKIEYLTGLLQGFEVDNSQAAQLKDIHAQPLTEIDKLKAVYTKENI